ncbi:MAG TPA: TIGR02266 family protein [Vicinamibacterales bacterium]|jgi:uncharacterized protein (TIGR02266 family)|nr:TIGR02266 family protein [Vicinamibacterales bacterium]
MTPVAAKTVLVAHRQAAVRDRFAVALADARHRFVAADSEATAIRAAGDPEAQPSLALVDLGLAADAGAFVRALRTAATNALPVVVFAGSVASAADVPSLDALGVGYVNEHASTPQILPALAPHLFPDNFNRRASPRVPAGVPVAYRAGTTVAAAVTLDIGKGGLAIRTMTPLARDTPIHVKFRLPGATNEIEATGRVAWADRKVGMGIQFEHVSSNDQRAIDAFLEEKRAQT